MDPAQKAVLSSHRRRRRRRAAITLTLVGLVMVGTFTYAAAYFQGWVGFGTPKPVPSRACQAAAPPKGVPRRRAALTTLHATHPNARAGAVG
mgnify:CR=1 FL=1